MKIKGDSNHKGKGNNGRRKEENERMIVERDGREKESEWRLEEGNSERRR